MELINFTKSSKWRSLYEKSKEQYWQPESQDCVSDKNQWHKLPQETKEIVLNLLQYAILLDSFQVSNLAEISLTQSNPMLRALLSFHSLMEAVHSQSYSYWAETVCSKEERDFLYSESPENKARLKVYADLNDEYRDLIANYFLEGVSFQALFRLSDILKSQGLLPGLSAILNLIKRDEDTHIVTFQHLISKSPVAMSHVEEAFNKAAKAEAAIVLSITGDSKLTENVHYAAKNRLKALGLKVEIPLDPFADLEGINDSSKAKLKGNFFTSNVMYGGRDESLDWEYENWFSE
jgi:ribonucleotide reductase beta subunit family protein with ferritin-like domain